MCGLAAAFAFAVLADKPVAGEATGGLVAAAAPGLAELAAPDLAGG